jgi:hypothetical protein
MHDVREAYLSYCEMLDESEDPCRYNESEAFISGMFAMIMLVTVAKRDPSALKVELDALCRSGETSRHIN